MKVAVLLVLSTAISLIASNPASAAGAAGAVTRVPTEPDVAAEVRAQSAAPVVIEIGEAAYLQISFTSKSILAPPGTSQPGYVDPDLVTRTNWTPEAATVPDPTTNPNNKMTKRMMAVVQATLGAGIMPLNRMTCVAGRAQNPASDHPNGRGCDFMFDYRTQFGVQSGWRMANWLVANQAMLGIKYVIWQGLIWNARSRPGPWTVYTSSAYGCPNPAVITGCHYDHIHVSVY